MANVLSLRRDRHNGVISTGGGNGDVADMEDSRDDSELFGCGEAYNVESSFQVMPFLPVVNASL